jgi:hypothetical protein
MKSAKEMLISESISLPLEIRDKIVKDVQISFHFADGRIHHVKPNKKISEKLSKNCLKRQSIYYKNWNFLDEEDLEI